MNMNTSIAKESRKEEKGMDNTLKTAQCASSMCFCILFLRYVHDFVIKDLSVSQVMRHKLVFLSTQAINAQMFKALGKTQAEFEMS